MADEGLHFKDWAAPIAAVLGVIFGWVGSLLGSVNRMQTSLAELAVKQSEMSEHMKDLDKKMQVLDRFGSRALEGVQTRLDNLACRREECHAVEKLRRRQEDQEGQEPEG